MFQQASIAGWEVQFDKASTVEAYGPLSVGCQCANCRNFLVAFNALPQSFFGLVMELGIDAAKPAEIVQYRREPNGLYLYSWWYHFVGKITDVAYVGQDRTPLTPLADGLRLTLMPDGELVPLGFPQPHVQLEFWANLPWQLNEPE